MESNLNLPFEIGQLAESKSFDEGYRGAWFRCKIMDIRMTKKDIVYDLDFFDFPDDKPVETEIYQKPPAGVPSKEKKLHLMVRPSFPPIYLETRMPDTSAISEVIVIVDGVWKVGDLVDWWFDNCYWSGRITDLLGEDEVKIRLPQPPMGEGGPIYKALYKDLRPSLDWSPEHGWTVPITSDGEVRQCCARLVQPSSLVIYHEPSQEGKSVKAYANSVSSHGSADASPSANISSSPSKRIPKQPRRAVKSEDVGDNNGLEKPTSSGSGSSTHAQPVSENSSADRPSKKMRLVDEIYRNTSDSIESALIDLEELVNKIKWMKRVHQFGFGCASAMTPPWKFLEDQPSCSHT